MKTLILTLLLVGVTCTCQSAREAANAKYAHIAQQHARCDRQYELCMDVCKDHVTSPSVAIDMEAVQKGKVECLQLCFTAFHRCESGVEQ